jgi:thymidine phosphorylase
VESGVACNAIITDMNQPLAWSAGNALEVSESIAYLRGDNRHERLHAVVMEIASELLVLGSLAGDLPSAISKLDQALASGRAAEMFARMVVAQGGPADLLERPDTHLVQAPLVKPVTAQVSGCVQSVDVRAIGLAVVKLGAGRVRAEDAVDHAVGISGLCQPGLQVTAHTPLATIHARNEEQWQRASSAIRDAVEVAEFPSAATHAPVSWNRIEGAKSA